MTKRELAIQKAKIAGYHDDSAAFTRLIIESRVSRQVMNEAWELGHKMKRRGVWCDCKSCIECAEQRIGELLAERRL